MFYYCTVLLINTFSHFRWWCFIKMLEKIMTWQNRSRS